MIENIRKYTGLMIVVLVLLFVGLVFLDGGSMSRAFGGKPVMQVGDTPISQKDYSRQTALIQLSQILPGGFPLPKETRILASHYLGDAAIENENLTSNAIIMEMARFLQVGFPYGPTSEDHFITNRITVQKAGLEYGATPSEAEVESFVEYVLFADPEGNPDQVAYSEFVKNRVSNIGGNRGFNEYIRDLLTAQNLAKLIGGGLSPELETIRLLYDTEKQIINGQQIALDVDTYEEKINPTEEELKAYFEENQDNYKSDELRKVSYVLVEPDWITTLKEVNAAKETAKKAAADKKAAEKAKAEAAAKKANEKLDAQDPKPSTPGTKPTEIPTPDTPTEVPTPDTPTEAPTTTETGEQGDPGEPGDPAPTPVEAPKPPKGNPFASLVDPQTTEPAIGSALDQAIEDAQTLPIVPKTPKEQLNFSEKNAAVEALDPKVQVFYDAILEKRGEEFESLAKENEFEVKQSEFFSKTDPPKVFSASVQNGRGGGVADIIFRLPTSGDADELLSEPLQTTDGWFMVRMDEVKTAVPLTFEEAKEKVTVDLKKKMAREAMIKDANDLREKLIAALAEGKSFEEAAKELEQEPTKLENLSEGQVFSFGAQSQKMPNPPAFDAAKLTNAGEIAPVKFTPSTQNLTPEEEATRALIILVEKREIVKDATYLKDLETAYKQRSRYTTLIAFENWLNDRYNESDVIPPKDEDK